ncbi:MAG: enoyl-CoA hydratase-related protein [Treponemataceae bacterium]|nr:MAG: enoyl-CoA hydratase-related protein [Treponemataceae bacterium]
MEYNQIQVSRAGGVAHVVMDNPAAFNALDMGMAADIADALEECGRDGDVKAVVLSGAGRGFCGGGDVRFFAEGVKKPGFTALPLFKAVSALTVKMKTCPKPVICAVHGAAAGAGCNLALAGDIVLASSDAKFIQSFVNVGLAPDCGGAYYLPRMIGSARAFEMFATGRPVGAQEALSLGLVTAVCAPEELMDKAASMAKQFAAGPGCAYAAMKKMLFASMYADAAAYMEIEASLQDECSKSEDFAEGVTAFLEKRKPVFKGK